MNKEQKDEIEHIILKLKDTSYLNKKIININNELEVVNTLLTGLSSVEFKPYIIENKKPYSDANRMELIMKEEELITMRNSIQKQIMEYEPLIQELDEDTKRIVVDLFILKKRHSVVAKENHYTRQAMYKKINSNFLKEFTL